jgi:aspartate-semialdehyde dehydrogenase
LYQNVSELLEDKNGSILDIDQTITDTFQDQSFPKENFLVPLAGSLIPWIDSDLGGGLSKEEWKGQNETLKILDQHYYPIKVDGLCVRIGTMRCHSQALTIKLNQNLSEDHILDKISNGNEWVKVISNNRDETIQNLSPTKVSGKLDILVGRVRKLNLDENIVSLFTIGDQLLWGAAEPLRRILSIITVK